MKTFDKLTLEKIAKKMLETNHSITTLELKNELRKQGYYALQSSVSQLMQELYDEGNGWAFQDNGSYRSYFCTQTTISDFISPLTSTSTANLGKIILTPKKKGSRKPMLPTLDPNITKLSSGCWRVFVPANKSSNSLILNEKFYSGSYTRDEVRCDYAKLMKVKFNDVRAKRF